MPDRRRHRGPHPRDPDLFAPRVHPVLAQAAGDLAWLLDRGYPEASALELVGNRHELRDRQREAVLRSACTREQRRARRSRELGVGAAAGRRLEIDGYNVLITVEAALAGGVLLLARDGCLRDLASLHGSFRRVEETMPALEILGRALAGWRLGDTTWYFDRPVSNSGRLAGRMRDLARERGWPWVVELVGDPDTVLRRSRQVVATSDSAILDRCGPWLNLARRVVDRYVPEAANVDLRPR